jgi:hypothetical protein
MTQSLRLVKASLGLIGLLAYLVVAAAPAHAADMSIQVSPNHGPADTPVTVRGSNYPPNETREVVWVCNWDPAAYDLRPFAEVDTGTGSWEVQARVPSNCNDSVIHVTTYGNSPSATFTISDQVIDNNPPSDPPAEPAPPPDTHAIPEWMENTFFCGLAAAPHVGWIMKGTKYAEDAYQIAGVAKITTEATSDARKGYIILKNHASGNYVQLIFDLLPGTACIKLAGNILFPDGIQEYSPPPPGAPIPEPRPAPEASR